jgi:translation initiation factor IF-1
MGKDDYMQFPGTVVEVCPNALFRVRLENDHVILAHLAGKLRIHNINIHQNDQVTVEMSTYDPGKGRIVFRHKQVKTL